MKEEIANIIESKPQAEKSIIKDQYENSILRWASMYDEIQARPDAQVDLSSNRVQQLNQIKERFEQLKNHINGLNIAENTNSLEQFKSYYRDFEQQYAQVLLEILSLVRAASVDLSDPAEVNKLIKRSQTERSKFEKSFEANLKKQAEGAARTLSKHFTKRISEINEGELTSPKQWIDRRNNWLKAFFVVSVIAVVSYVLIVTQGWASGYEIQVALVKFSILAAVYSQVYFSQRNYHISAALLIDYEHRKAVSDTLTDFFSDGIQDEPLKDSTIAHATKTIYAPVTTGHLKNEQESTSIDSIVKQYLPADLGK